MLRITAFLALLLCSASIWAEGFYLGAGVGPQAIDFDQNARIIVQPPGSGVTTNIEDTTHHSGTGIFGTIFGGYGWHKQRFYLGTEANGNISSAEFESTNTNFTHNTSSHTDYKIQNSFGLSLLPGFLYTPKTLFYGRLGYDNGNFKISTSDSSLANISKRLNGFRYGLGFKYFFTPHVAARMEYSQINYKSTQFTVVSGAATKTTNIDPSVGQVEFGLSYDF